MQSIYVQAYCPEKTLVLLFTGQQWKLATDNRNLQSWFEFGDGGEREER